MGGASRMTKGPVFRAEITNFSHSNRLTRLALPLGPELSAENETGVECAETKKIFFASTENPLWFCLFLVFRAAR